MNLIDFSATGSTGASQAGIHAINNPAAAMIPEPRSRRSERKATMKTQAAPKLIEHDFYPLDQFFADIEYDRLREDGYHSYQEQKLVEEAEERRLRG